ncbi:MAG: glycosyltransferase [Magnetococcales bacterium]|nr:glycosyltransferase [Magnetococcales bacterium]NGZ26093.1 glycosyltransferase [Magnetococcales bacterium]
MPDLQQITILHLIANLKTGGAQRVLQRLVTSSRHPQLRHVVVSMGGRGLIGDELVQAGVEVYALNMTTPWRYPLALVKLAHLLNRLHPSLLQSWLYPADLLAWLVGVGRVPRVYWNIRCTRVVAKGWLDYHGWLPWLLGKLSRRVTGVVVNSWQGMEDHRQLGYAPHHWQVIVNGIDGNNFKPCEEARTAWRQRLGVPEDGVVFGLLARNHPMKGQQEYIQAAAALAKQEEKVYFLLAGRQVEMEDPLLGPLVVASGCPQKFFLLGEMQQVERVMAALDVLVIPSLWGEGFSNTLAEGMACALPCIATQCGDAQRMVPEGTPLLPAGDIPALHQAMATMVELGKEGRSSLGNLGRQHVLAHFSLQEMISRYESLYSGSSTTMTGTSLPLGSLIE